MKRISTLLLSIVLVISCSVTAFASEVTVNNGAGSVPVVLTQETTNFSVTVPTVLPVWVSATHDIEVATDAKIINNGFGPVCVKSVTVESLGAWELVDFNSDLVAAKVNSNQYGLQFMWSNVQTDGTCSVENFPSIKGNNSMGLVYAANISVLSSEFEGNIAKVTFVVGWDDGTIVTGTDGVEYPWRYTVNQNGTATLKEYLGENGTGVDLTVPNTIAGYPVDRCAATKLNGNTVKFNTVTVEDGVSLAPEIFYNTEINRLVIGTNVTFEKNNNPYGNENKSATRTPFGMSVTTSFAGGTSWRTNYSGAKVKVLETHSPITHYAIFGESEDLTSVTFGSEITTIDRQLFKNCPNLDVINVMNKEEDITFTGTAGVIYGKYNFIG